MSFRCPCSLSCRRFMRASRQSVVTEVCIRVARGRCAAALSEEVGGRRRHRGRSWRQLRVGAFLRVRFTRRWWGGRRSLGASGRPSPRHERLPAGALWGAPKRRAAAAGAGARPLGRRRPCPEAHVAVLRHARAHTLTSGTIVACHPPRHYGQLGCTPAAIIAARALSEVQALASRSACSLVGRIKR